MILCDFKDIEHQIAINPRLKKAIDFLRRPDLPGLPDGKVELDGEQVFAIVQRYETVITDSPKFEYHRKYVDIQYIASGEEIIGWAPIERMAITEMYDAERDIAFGSVASNQSTRLLLQAGQAAVLYPEDGHAPKLAAGSASAVMKIVVKVAVSI
jgi:YhcH/YjgK/YiaL family protein